MLTKNESGKFLKRPAVDLNKNRKAASRWHSIDGGAVIRGAYYAYVN
jgi:hypothetical protein